VEEQQKQLRKQLWTLGREEEEQKQPLKQT
jgi:hypothetical protein